jgi:parvulin-like peptidyl-prolyl isomerase
LLWRQFIAKAAPPAEPAAVDKEYATLLAVLKSQGTTIDEYCKKSHQSEKQVRAGLEAMLRWKAYLTKKLTDEVLQQYYQEYKDYFDGATVQCSYIVYRLPQGAAPAERDDAVKKMRQLRQRIIDQQLTFADAARKYSHDPKAAKGGALGLIQRKHTVEEPCAKAIFSLKAGEISDVVVCSEGVTLFMATDRDNGKPSEFSQVRDKVRECYTDDLAWNIIADARKTAKIEMHLP